MFAEFVRPKGTGEAQIRPAAAYSCSILSAENRAGALRSNFRSYQALVFSAAISLVPFAFQSP